MSFDPFGDDLTETQWCIVDTAQRNPDMTPKQIADHCDCSASYVRQTLRENRSGFGDLGIDIDDTFSF